MRAAQTVETQTRSNGKSTEETELSIQSNALTDDNNYSYRQRLNISSRGLLGYACLGHLQGLHTFSIKRGKNQQRLHRKINLYAYIVMFYLLYMLSSLK